MFLRSALWSKKRCGDRRGCRKPTAHSKDWVLQVVFWSSGNPDNDLHLFWVSLLLLFRLHLWFVDSQSSLSDGTLQIHLLVRITSEKYTDHWCLLGHFLFCVLRTDSSSNLSDFYLSDYLTFRFFYTMDGADLAFDWSRRLNCIDTRIMSQVVELTDLP